MLVGKTVWRFSPQAAEGVDFFADNVRVNGAGTQFTLHSPFGTAEIALYRCRGATTWPTRWRPRRWRCRWARRSEAVRQG